MISNRRVLKEIAKMQQTGMVNPQAAALKHVVTPLFHCKVAGAQHVAHAMGAGVKVEDAGDE